MTEVRRLKSTESGSSGSFEVKRRRIMGAFDAPGAHRALELLAENSLYGSIVVSDGLADVCFFFTRGGLRVIAAGRSLPSLAERLRQRGQLGPEEQRKVEQTLAKQKETKSRLLLEEREALIEAARVKPTDVDEVAREVIAEAFLDCLFWDGAQFEAATGEPNQEIMQRRDLSAVTLSLGVADLVERLQQKIRSVSEVRRTVSSMRVTVEPTPRGKEAVEKREKLGDGPVGERRTRLMSIVAREAGVKAPDLCVRLKVGELELASLLHELTVQGFVKLDRPPPDKKEELERLRKMEEAIDQALSQLLRRMRLAEESAAAGDTGKAARHMARAGGILLQEGREDEAARTFGSALKHSQDDLEAREGYVQSLWATGRTQEALEQSEELGRRYLGLNLPARAKKILERALGREERTGALDLLVTTLVKLRLPKAAAEAGERLVNRLRREGKRDEARQAASRLLEIADPADRERILRAIGVDRRRALALIGSLVLILALLVPAQSALAEKQRFHQATVDAHDELGKKRPPEATAATVARLEAEFDQLAGQGGELGEAAARIKEDLGRIRGDLQLYLGELQGAALPWRAAEDLEEALRRIQEVKRKIRSEPMRLALESQVTAIEAFKDNAETARDKLSALAPGREAIAEARRMVEVYRGLPDLLRETRVSIQLTTRPPGASVRWGGIPYDRTTPLSLQLPLTLERELVIELDGHEPVKRTVALETFPEGGVLDVLLDPVRPTREPARPERDPPKPQVEPVKPADPPAGVVAVDKPPPEPAPPAEPPPAIETRDEVTGPAEKHLFEPSTRYFASLELPRIYRAAVFLQNRVDARGQVWMDGLRVHLVVKTRLGWVMQKQGVTRKFDDPMERRVQARPDGTRLVLRLESQKERTLHFDPEELRAEAQAGLQEAVKDYLHRRGR